MVQEVTIPGRGFDLLKEVSVRARLPIERQEDEDMSEGYVAWSTYHYVILPAQGRIQIFVSLPEGDGDLVIKTRPGDMFLPRAGMDVRLLPQGEEKCMPEVACHLLDLFRRLGGGELHVQLFSDGVMFSVGGLDSLTVQICWGRGGDTPIPYIED